MSCICIYVKATKETDAQSRLSNPEPQTSDRATSGQFAGVESTSSLDAASHVLKPNIFTVSLLGRPSSLSTSQRSSVKLNGISNTDKSADACSGTCYYYCDCYCTHACSVHCAVASNMYIVVGGSAKKLDCILSLIT